MTSKTKGRSASIESRNEVSVFERNSKDKGRRAFSASALTVGLGCLYQYPPPNSPAHVFCVE